MTPPMTSYKFGDVVLAPFPFTDQTASKQRPAVIVSSAAYNANRPDIIVMPISSRPGPVGTVGEVAIVQWQAASLLYPSVVKPSSPLWNTRSSSASSVSCKLVINTRSEQRSKISSDNFSMCAAPAFRSL